MKYYIVHYRAFDSREPENIACYTTKKEAIAHVRKHHQEQVEAKEGIADDGSVIWRFKKEERMGDVVHFEGIEYEGYEYIDTIVIRYGAAKLADGWTMSGDERYEIDIVKGPKLKEEENLDSSESTH